MKDLGIVRRLYYREGLSLSKIERRTGLTRKTVRRWLNAAEGTEPKAYVPLRFELGEAFLRGANS